MSVIGLDSLRKCASAIGVSHAYLSKLKKEGHFTDHDVPGKKRRAFKLSEVKAAVQSVRGVVEEIVPKKHVDIFSDEMNTEKYIEGLNPKEKKEHDAAVREAENKKKENERKLKELKDKGVDVSDIEDEMEDAKKGSLIDVRIQTEKYRGLNYKLDFLKKSHQQIDLDEIQEVLYKAGKHLQDVLLATPRRNAPLLVGMDNAYEIEKMLEDENINALHEFARIIKDDLMDKHS